MAETVFESRFPRWLPRVGTRMIRTPSWIISRGTGRSSSPSVPHVGFAVYTVICQPSSASLVASSVMCIPVETISG
jgi:hypothetical protein